MDSSAMDADRRVSTFRHHLDVAMGVVNDHVNGGGARAQLCADFAAAHFSASMAITEASNRAGNTVANVQNLLIDARYALDSLAAAVHDFTTVQRDPQVFRRLCADLYAHMIRFSHAAQLHLRAYQPPAADPPTVH
jgi:hypothetical protein